mgnify:CR=1 FL=1
MLNDNTIREHKLSVVRLLQPRGAVLSTLLKVAMKRWSIYEEDSRVNDASGELTLTYDEAGTATSSQLVVDYIGYEHFDLRVTINDVTTRPINLGRCRYRISGALDSTMVGRLTSEMIVQVGLGESSTWIATTEDEYCLNRPRNNGRPVHSGESYRKAYQNPSDEPSVIISTTNAEFRKILNKCKGGAFCIVSRDNRIGIYNSESEQPVVTPVNTDYSIEDGVKCRNAIASVDYQMLYFALYRRKQNLEGLITTINQAEDYDITEYGIIDGKVYLVISGEGISARLLFTTTGATDTGVEIPEIKERKKRTRRSSSTQSQTDAGRLEQLATSLAESSQVLPVDTAVEFTEEETTRLNLWLQAHTRWVTYRNQSPSTSRQVWFSHYSMMLIQTGEAPDELDFQIMSKV